MTTLRTFDMAQGITSAEMKGWSFRGRSGKKETARRTSVCPDSLLRYRANAVVSFGIRRYKIVTSWLTKPLNTLEVSEGS